MSKRAPPAATSTATCDSSSERSTAPHPRTPNQDATEPPTASSRSSTTSDGSGLISAGRERLKLGAVRVENRSMVGAVGYPACPEGTTRRAASAVKHPRRHRASRAHVPSARASIGLGRRCPVSVHAAAMTGVSLARDCDTAPRAAESGALHGKRRARGKGRADAPGMESRSMLPAVRKEPERP